MNSYSARNAAMGSASRDTLSMASNIEGVKGLATATRVEIIASGFSCPRHS